MKRKDFGELVSALRKEHINKEGDLWRQTELVEEANKALEGLKMDRPDDEDITKKKRFTETQISNIECGRAKRGILGTRGYRRYLPSVQHSGGYWR